MILNRQKYMDKVRGCWMGKNIGGTLGAPFEWRRQVNQVSFYTQELGGDPLPNDDLDIQLLWLVALEEQGVEIDSHLLGEYWLLYVTPYWSEYGNAKINLRSGLLPPLSGSYCNPYKDSCGAFIRSEIWACIAPGDPKRAARYAYEDAIIDHGDGEGTYAEVFCAALESAAFVVQDIPTLVDIGLSYIPSDCGVAGAVRLAMDCHRQGLSWLEARQRMLEQFRGSAFLGSLHFVSAEDQARGFHEGRLGWDVPSNIGMLLIGLLYGEGDFARTLCVAVNCGEDTDCTAATAGSIFGILRGVEAIPDRWIAPIGKSIKTACLNLGELGYFGNQLPQDVEDMTLRTARIARQVSARFGSPLEISDAPGDLTDLNVENLKAGRLLSTLYASLGGPRYHFDFFDVSLDYGGSPVIRANTPRPLRLTIWNTYKTQASLKLRWLVPEGWQVSPSAQGQVFMPVLGAAGNPLNLDFTLLAERISESPLRLAVEIVVDSRSAVMIVPVVFLQDFSVSSQ